METCYTGVNGINLIINPFVHCNVNKKYNKEHINES